MTASGQNQCNGNTVNNSVTTTCPLVTAPQISVTKSCPATPVIEGGLLVFTGTVTNTGNITLTNVIVVNNRPAANTTVLGPITLAPGAGTNFTRQLHRAAECLLGHRHADRHRPRQMHRQHRHQCHNDDLPHHHRSRALRSRSAVRPRQPPPAV